MDGPRRLSNQYLKYLLQKRVYRLWNGGNEQIGYVWIEVRVSSETEIARNLLGTRNDVLRKWKDPSNCGSEGNCCFERGAKLERCIQGLNE